VEGGGWRWLERVRGNGAEADKPAAKRGHAVCLILTIATVK
jgi:hypothetical protein